MLLMSLLAHLIRDIVLLNRNISNVLSLNIQRNMSFKEKCTQFRHIRKCYWNTITAGNGVFLEDHMLACNPNYSSGIILTNKSNVLSDLLNANLNRAITNPVYITAMFKYTKRLISDIRFWCQELKIRSKENAEWERIEDEKWRHPMAGFGYYTTIKRNRAERKRIHAEQRELIS